MRASSYGWVYHRGRFRPFFKWRPDIADTGRVVVVLREDGREIEVLINKENVKRFPSEKEENR